MSTVWPLRRLLGLLVLVALLLAPGGTHAAGTAPGRTPPADSLSAAAVAFELRYGAEPAPSAPASRDRWLGRDKGQHVVVSGLWTLSTQYVLVNKADWTAADALPASVASGAAIGLAKELYDASRPTGTASGKDLVADAVGIGLAVGVIVL
jgi:uncharacterized protein YfiM (DUF2279 family)